MQVSKIIAQILKRSNELTEFLEPCISAKQLRSLIL